MLPTLYKKDKTGRIRQWTVKIKDNYYWTEYGYTDGDIQVSDPTFAEPKNVGRSNETSASEQALLEATSKWNKKKDKGYVEDINKIHAVVWLPMTAHKYKDRKDKVVFPQLAQFKYNGVRALYDPVANVLSSRLGKHYTAPVHILEDLKKVAPKNIVLDGELYSDTLSFEELVGLVRKVHMEKEDLQKLKNNVYYVVYDSIRIDGTKSPFINRYPKHIEITDYIRLAPTWRVLSHEEVEKYLKYAIKNGYEGIMLRHPGSFYELNERSPHLLKVKPAYDQEYEIIGFTDGVGKSEGCIIFTCITDEGETFDVVPKGSLENRRKMFKEGDKYVGKLLTVEYEDVTKDGKPKFAKGIAIRDYE